MPAASRGGRRRRGRGGALIAATQRVRLHGAAPRPLALAGARGPGGARGGTPQSPLTLSHRRPCGAAYWGDAERFRAAGRCAGRRRRAGSAGQGRPHAARRYVVAAVHYDLASLCRPDRLRGRAARARRLGGTARAGRVSERAWARTPRLRALARTLRCRHAVCTPAMAPVHARTCVRPRDPLPPHPPLPRGALLPHWPPRSRGGGRGRQADLGARPADDRRPRRKCASSEIGLDDGRHRGELRERDLAAAVALRRSVAEGRVEACAPSSSAMRASISSATSPNPLSCASSAAVLRRPAGAAARSAAAPMRASSRRAMPAWPRAHAFISAVEPVKASASERSAPASTSSRAVASRPCHAA